MKKGNRKALRASTVGNSIDKWAMQLADRVAKEALRELIKHAVPLQYKGTDPVADQCLKDWLAPLEFSSRRIGAEAVQAALLNIQKNGPSLEFADFACALTGAARSHQGRKARRAIPIGKGRAREPWRLHTEELLSNMTFMKRIMAKGENESDAIINKLIDDCAIDEGDDGYFDHSTGKRVATGKPNLRSEISKIKKQLLKKKNTM